MRLPRSEILVLVVALAAPIAHSVASNDESARINVQQEGPPITIESDQPSPPPSEKELRHRFREPLSPRASVPEERVLSDGTVEITTQVARLCAKPSPVQSQSGVGGKITLAAPCVQF